MTTQYDLLQYLRGNGRQYKLHYEWSGGGDQWLETQFGETDNNGTGRFFQVKGYPDRAMWEELMWDSKHIWRGADTSPNTEEVYVLKEGNINDMSTVTYGSPWCPRLMVIGDSMLRTPIVFWYKKHENVETRRYQDNTWIKLLKHHDTWKGNANLSIADVLELGWYLGNPNTPGSQVAERYWYAKNYGLVGWQGGIGFSYITEEYPIGSRLPLNRETIWFTPPPLNTIPLVPGDIVKPPPVEPPPVEYPDIPPVNDVRWQEAEMSATGTYANVRVEPTITATVIDTIAKNERVWIIESESYVDINQKTWLPLKTIENNITSLGWVRTDVVTYTYYENEQVVTVEISFVGSDEQAGELKLAFDKVLTTLIDSDTEITIT